MGSEIAGPGRERYTDPITSGRSALGGKAKSVQNNEVSLP
jgi:hypothetical protein